MTGGRAGRRALFGVLFLLSGAAGLVYEQLWIRELQEFFGSTIHSITTVVAAYMGGLGLGAWVMGRRADRHPSPARLYGILELAIGVFGLMSPWIFRGVGAGYLGLARVFEPGLWVGTAIKFAAAFTVMLVPTFLMGGTLPILTRAFAGPWTANLRRELALFYGLNTVGAVFGCALAGYVLVEHAGLTSSLLATGMVNLLLGAAALAITRAGPVEPPAEPEPESLLAEPGATTRRAAIWLVAATAFASLLYEIAWTRVLVLLVGGSTYAFTTILACFLLGIGLGSLVAIGRGRAIRELLLRAALVQAAIAVLASLLFPFFRVLPVYIVATLQIRFLGAVGLLLLHGLAVAAVIVPPAFGMGLAFPLLAELAARRGGTSGSETGRAYFANTAGSIFGAAITGFVLVHLVGVERTLQMGVVVNVAAALVLVWCASREGSGATRLSEGERAPALLAVLGLVIALFTPSWSSRLLDRGPAIYGHDVRTREVLDYFLRGRGAEQLAYREGWNATVSVWRNASATWLKVNGKSDASSIADMDTQVLVGLLPALAHPGPRRALVIGLGSGASVRAVADVPGVEHLDVVEIERAVVDVQPLFAEVNRDVLADPRVRLIEDDARSALQLAREPYDVVVSEPTNPWIAGVASLFTPEFFRVVRGRLAPGGVFAQWVQLYRVPESVVSVVVRNLRSVFPHVEMWQSNPSDLVLLASDGPIRWNRDRIAASLDTALAVGRSLRDWARLRQPSDILGRYLLGEEGLRRLAEVAAFPHDDDHPALEFVAARGLLVRAGTGTYDTLLELKETLSDSLPAHLEGWSLEPGEWQAAAARMLPAETRLSLSLAERALALDPDNAEWRGVLGTVLFERRETSAALPHLRNALLSRPDDPWLLVSAGLATLVAGDRAEGRALLERARGLGGDSVYATSALAEDAVIHGDHALAAAETRRALRGLRPTLATPFPAALESAVRRLTYEARPDIAAPVLDLLRETRPGWDLAWFGSAALYARWSGANCARAVDFALELERFGWNNREIADLVRSCARGR